MPLSVKPAQNCERMVFFMIAEIIGHFGENVINALGLNIATGTEIILSEHTIKHIKDKHPEITGDCKRIIADIIAVPHGVSFRAKDSTIGFFKGCETGELFFLELSVRSSNIGEYFVRTLHFIETDRVEKRMKNGKIISLDKYLYP